MTEPIDHVLPQKTYFIIGGILMVLLAATVGVALLDLGPLNVVAALGVALFKAVLVVLYFMHVKYSSRLTWIFAGGGILWLIILFLLTLTDYMSR